MGYNADHLVEDLFYNCLKIDPSKRFDCDQILNHKLFDQIRQPNNPSKLINKKEKAEKLYTEESNKFNFEEASFKSQKIIMDKINQYQFCKFDFFRTPRLKDKCH
jgi:serine/threonine protein kinase